MLDVLPRSAHFDIYNDLTQTPLHLAVITRQYKIVDKLIDLGARIDLVDRNGQTCVHLACQNGDIHSLRAIFKPRPTRVQLQDILREILEVKNFDGRTSILQAFSSKVTKFVIGCILNYGSSRCA